MLKPHMFNNKVAVIHDHSEGGFLVCLNLLLLRCVLLLHSQFIHSFQELLGYPITCRMSSQSDDCFTLSAAKGITAG